MLKRGGISDLQRRRAGQQGAGRSSSQKAAGIRRRRRKICMRRAEALPRAGESSQVIFWGARRS